MAAEVQESSKLRLPTMREILKKSFRSFNQKEILDFNGD